MATLRYNAHQSTGDFNGITAGNSVAGNAVFLNEAVRQKASSLSAVVVVKAETNTMTLTALWQVSNDKSTWLDLAYAPNNAAAVVIATGTAGADAAVTKVFQAPEAVNGYRFARIAIVVGVQTGTASDTYTIGYSYRQLV